MLSLFSEALGIDVRFGDDSRHPVAAQLGDESQNHQQALHHVHPFPVGAGINEQFGCLGRHCLLSDILEQSRNISSFDCSRQLHMQPAASA